MHTYSQDYEIQLKVTEEDIDSGQYLSKEYFNLLPEYLQKKYIQKCSENPSYNIELWIYTQMSENQKSLLHKLLLKYGEEINEDILRLLPENVRNKWIANHTSNLDYIPDMILPFLNKEKHSNIIETIYKNMLADGRYLDRNIFEFLSDSQKLNYILQEGLKRLGTDAEEWLKTFKKAHSREEIIKTIIDGN
jgi:hypothetical protein